MPTPPTQHLAIVTPAARAPLQTLQRRTRRPSGNEVLVKVHWVASTPLDLHQADGGLLVEHPQVLGGGLAGEVVETGPEARRLRVGDRVFGYTWRDDAERAQQEYVTAPETLMGKIPPNLTPQAAATVPTNFVTAWNTLVTYFGFPLPWPKPVNYVPAEAHAPILVWGAASSVGQYSLQLLKHYGYGNVLATASAAHHDALRALGATRLFDYRDPDVVERILAAAAAAQDGKGTPAVPYILDCIGHKTGSLAPIARIAQRGSKVAVMLPVVVREATEEQRPEYAMTADDQAAWAEGVEVMGVRTHFYCDNEYLKEHLQPDIMPALLAEGVITPNRQKVVEGATALERAERALALFRKKQVRNEKLVWRMAEE